MEPNEVAQGQKLVEAMAREEAARLGVSFEGLEWGQDADDEGECRSHGIGRKEIKRKRYVD